MNYVALKDPKVHRVYQVCKEKEDFKVYRENEVPLVLKEIEVLKDFREIEVLKVFKETKDLKGNKVFKEFLERMLILKKSLWLLSIILTLQNRLLKT